MALKVQDFKIAGESNSGINYTFIVRVTENSVNEELNSSNVTIQAILKSGYTKTSFIGQTIKFILQLGDQTLVDREAWRTCEGTAEHIYETWTGDVTHDDDGTATLSVDGELDSWSTFTAMPPDMTVSGTMELTQIVLNSPPEIPQGLTAPALVALNGEVPVAWDISVDPDGNLKEYVLERSDDGGESFYTVYTGSNTGLSDEAADIAGLKMLYRVCAIDDNGAFDDFQTAL